MKVKKHYFQKDRSVSRTIVGMQIHFPSELVDEGVEQAFDAMKEKGVNTVFMLTNIDCIDSKHWGRLTHNPKRERIVADGFFYELHPELYKNTKIKPARTMDPGFRDRDVFGEALKTAHDRDMKFYAFILNRFPHSERYWDCFARDVLDRPIPKVFCLNNPDVRNLYEGMIEDLLTNYDIDGVFLDLLDHSVQFGFKKLPDELVEVFGSAELEKPEMGLTCFCKHCRQLASGRGYDVDAIKKGLIRGVRVGYIPKKVEELFTADEALKFLMEVPEYLEWLRFRVECTSEIHAELYSLVKSLNRNAEVALDIYGPRDSWKYASDFRMLSKHCDWIKVMFYSGTYPATPLTPEQIYSETRRAIGEVEGKVDIVAGINAIAQTPEYVRQSVVRALNAGVKGVIISWDYGLIPFENMEAARRAILKVRSRKPAAKARTHK